MNFEEHAAKAVLAAAGIPTPKGGLATTPDAAADLVREIGPAAVKAQVATGKRGKAGGIRLVGTPEEATESARAILGMTIGDYRVEKVLVEAQAPIARELYAAVLNDPQAKAPLVMVSGAGGMEIEELAEANPEAIRRHTVDLAEGFSKDQAKGLLVGLDLGPAEEATARLLAELYQVYRTRDAELLEINPLVITKDDQVLALDCKLVIDDGALPRQTDIADQGTPEPATTLEARGQALGLKYMELDGSVGVLANGAGLTMTTMDAVVHYGGRPANFLEIGGEAYTKATPALELVLDNPKVKSLLVNFCGAFARCDVMTEGVITAWETLKPDLPVFFSIHGTGDLEAIAMLKNRLGIEPYALMDDAVKAAVAAAKEAGVKEVGAKGIGQ